MEALAGLAAPIRDAVSQIAVEAQVLVIEHGVRALQADVASA
jgi:hypothetical protein